MKNGKKELPKASDFPPHFVAGVDDENLEDLEIALNELIQKSAEIGFIGGFKAAKDKSE